MERKPTAPYDDDSDVSDWPGTNGFSQRWIHLWAKTCLCLRCTGVDCLGWSGMTFSRFCESSKVSGWSCPGGTVWETHQVVVDTLVELPLGGAALPQLLVVVFEALPVGAELLEAGLVDVLDPGTSVSTHPNRHSAHWFPIPPTSRASNPGTSDRKWHIHAPRASGDPAALLQALELAPARVLRLALHVVVIVVLAAGADEERGREERGGAGTDLLDLGDGVW